MGLKEKCKLLIHKFLIEYQWRNLLKSAILKQRETVFFIQEKWKSFKQINLEKDKLI